MCIRWLGSIALCTLAAGCQLANNAIHNVTNEVKLATAEVQEHHNYEKLAKASWQSAQADENCRATSKDYAAGFKDGFVDYLEFGGSGQPPYLPPRSYWGPTYRTPEGYRAIEDWFAGFRHGVDAAKQSGYRQWVPLPSASTAENEKTGGPTVSHAPKTNRFCGVPSAIDSE